METYHWLIFIGGSLGLAITTGGACHWWYSRKLAASMGRLNKLERAHEFSVQQTLQARKQIERLQKELASALQRVSALSASAQAPVASRGPSLAEVLRAGDTAAARASGDMRGALPVHGFADTEPMERSRRA